MADPHDDPQPQYVDPCGPSILAALHQLDGTASESEGLAEASEIPTSTPIEGWLECEIDHSNPLFLKARACFTDWLATKRESVYDLHFAFALARDLISKRYDTCAGNLDEGLKAWGAVIRDFNDDIEKQAGFQGQILSIPWKYTVAKTAKLLTDMRQISCARYRSTLTMPFIVWICDGNSAEASRTVVEVYRRLRQDVNEHAHKLKLKRDEEYQADMLAAGDDQLQLASVLWVFKKGDIVQKPSLLSWENNNIRSFDCPREETPISISSDDDDDADDASIDAGIDESDDSSGEGHVSRKRPRLSEENDDSHVDTFVRLKPTLPSLSEVLPGYRQSAAASRLADEYGYNFERRPSDTIPRPDDRAIPERRQPTLRHHHEQRARPKAPAASSFLDLEVRSTVRVLSASLVAALKQQQHLQHLQESDVAPAAAVPDTIIARFPRLEELTELLDELSLHFRAGVRHAVPREQQ